MAFEVDPGLAESAHGAMLSAFAPRDGELRRLTFEPDGAGGETEMLDTVGSVRFGVSGRSVSQGIDGERTRAATFATLKVAMDTDVREKDVIRDRVNGEHW